MKNMLCIGGPVDGMRLTKYLTDHSISVPIMPKHDVLSDELPKHTPAGKEYYTVRKIICGQKKYYFFGHEDLNDEDCIAMLIMKYPKPKS